MKLLKFTATWCGPCKNLAKAMEHINLPYEVISYDVDEQSDAVREYNVRGVPFMVLVDDEGKTIRSMSGFSDVDKLKDFLAG